MIYRANGNGVKLKLQARTWETPQNANKIDTFPFAR